MRDVYHRLLVKMQRDRWKVFGHRYRLSRFTKLLAILRGWLRVRFSGGGSFSSK
jgi:hypothetical protein